MLILNGDAYRITEPNVNLKFITIEKTAWRAAAILKIEKLLQSLLQLQNDALHKFGNKTANINIILLQFILSVKRRHSGDAMPSNISF